MPDHPGDLQADDPSFSQGPKVSELRPAGDREALYREVPAGCYDRDAGTSPDGVQIWGYHDQRSWLLPESEILIVDNWDIEEFDDILAAAEFGERSERATRSVEFRNMTLELPGEWEVERREAEFSEMEVGTVQGEWLLIRTDPDVECREPEWWGGHYECPNIRVFGSGGVRTGYALGPVDGTNPFYPAAEPYNCDPAYDTTAPEPTSPLEPEEDGLADIGERRARYQVWYVSCTDASGDRVGVDGPTVYYEQRLWLLPESEILVVDNHRTGGLGEILADSELPA